MAEETGLKRYFGYDLAVILGAKISAVDPGFDQEAFLWDVKTSDLGELELMARVDLLARKLNTHLPGSYTNALAVLVDIYGPENPNETGMFTFGYWLWPIARFIELYGLDDFETSIRAIEELTKRHTGEHAVRPYIEARPDEMARVMLEWASSENVHVRRLASEGLRPRLPWARKLRVFIEEPRPVFDVLDMLKDDRSKFVQKSVANNVNDYLKDNRPEAIALLRRWSQGASQQSLWIIKHALRNELKRGEPDALALVQ